MLLNNAIQIISNGRIALGDLAFAVAGNQKKGLNATDEQKELRRRMVLTWSILKILDTMVVINENDQVEYVLGGYSHDKINRILLFLKGVSKQKNLPVVSKILNPIVESSSQGGTGQTGPAGASSYVYIGYADDASGGGYSTSATGKEFIAFRQSSIVISPVTAATFAGLWRQFVGDTGADGDDGADGQDVYIYHAWADDASGTGFTLTFNAAKKYTAIRTSTTILTPVVGDFAGLWAKYIGENGTNGSNGTNGNTILSGTGAPSSGLGVNGDYYRDIANSNFYGPKTAGAWGAPLDLKGDQGDAGNDGADGSDGADGANAFVYIAYADAADGTGFTLIYSATKEWIAILSTDTEIPSPALGDFTGLFRRYIGDGDRYATTSSTSLTIGTGNQFLTVDPDLSYTTGQRAVIALTGDSSNRMEGTVVDYNPITGQMTIDVDADSGAGTYAVWSVNLVGIPSSAVSLIGSSIPSTAGGTVTLDFNGKIIVIFTGSAVFGGAKIIAYSNDSLALKFDFMFQIGNVSHALTFPSNTRMNDIRFNSITKIWASIAEIGFFKAHGTFDGTNWWIDISTANYT
jgi:hypothetical protein